MTSCDPPGRAPLAGIRVVDCSQIGAGPYLASMLGDLGADVIKVEPPEGEPFRAIDHDFGVAGSSYFFGMNRSKRSLVLDLKSDRGNRAFLRLIDTADVVIVSMRPAALVRLQIDYESLASRNPRLIYCSITAFGEDGPRAAEPGMDILAQALSGVMGTTGEEGREPVKVGAAISDFSTTYAGGFAICAALVARERDSVGQKISLNLLDTSISLMANYVTSFFRTGLKVRPMGSGHPQLVPYQVFKASDGFLVVACLNDRFWPGLCRALDREDLVRDERYATNADRVLHRDAVIREIATEFEARSTEEWSARLRAEDVPFSPVNRIEEVFDDPQVRHNKMLIELEHPDVGAYYTTNNPIRMSRTPVSVRRYAPRLGEHSREILEELGYCRPEIESLLEG